MSYDTPEGKIKKRGRDICRFVDLYFFPVNQGGMSASGIPDDVVNFWGVFGHIEYKAHMRWDKNNKAAHKTLPTDKQCLHLERCRERGGISLVVDDENIDYLDDVLYKIRAVAQHSGNIKEIQRVAQESICGWNWTYTDYNNYKIGSAGALFLPPKKTIPVWNPLGVRL